MTALTSIVFKRERTILFLTFKYHNIHSPVINPVHTSTVLDVISLFMMLKCRQYYVNRFNYKSS